MGSYDHLTDEEYLNHPKITSLNKTHRIMTNIVKNIRAQQEAEKQKQSWDIVISRLWKNKNIVIFRN